MITIYKLEPDRTISTIDTDPFGLAGHLKKGWSTSPCGTKRGMAITRLKAKIMLAKACGRGDDKIKELEAELQSVIDNDLPESEIRARAKELKIRNWHNRKLDKLKELIREAERKKS